MCELKRNVLQIAMITKQDTEQGHTSAAARGRSIKPPTHGKPKKKAPVPLGPKSVNFGEPTYFEHSGGEYSEGSQDDYSFDYDEDDDERHVQGAFSDEDDEEPTSEDDEDMYNGEDHGDATVTDPPARMQKQSEIRPLQHHSEVRPLQPRPAQVIHQDSDSTVQGYNGQQLSPEAREAAQMRSMGMSVDDMLREQQPQYAPQPLQLRKPGGGQGQQQPLAPTRNGPQQELQSPKTIGRGSFEQGDTKKINLTPDIANTAPRDGPTPAPQQHYIPSPKQQQQLMAAQGMKTFAVPGPSTQEDEESMEGHSSVVSSSGSHTSSNSPQRLRKHSKSTGSVSSNENSPEDGNASPGKRKKSGGMFSGLFGRNKKDKEKKAGSSQLSRNNSVDRSSTPTQAQPHPDPSKQSSRLMSPEPPVVRRQAPPSMASLLPQSKNDQDDYLEPEAKQQQQIEAQNALYQQYGIQRPPGGHSNQFTPQSNRENLGLSSPAHANSAPATSKPLRPGSLLGSPAYPGLEAPTLSVLRVFSGDTVPVEATFKTVLLNESTSTSELLKQTLQRFRLPLDRIDDFYLVIQDVDQDQEKELQVTDKPLTVFQDLADEAHQARMVPPSVKRSSVSSISSASSNLSTHPAIAKLPMGDFSDDSAVKMYLHCKAITPRASIERQLSQSKTSVSNVDPETASTASSSATTTAPAAPASTPHDSLSANFGTRFAVKIAISSDDLPEGHMFDPQSAAIVPRQAIEHRLSGQSAASQGVRHKYIFFSTNSTVTQVIETALDRFAIMGGVVDGGDEVEDKLAKRRSITRTRYSLVQLDAQGSGKRDIHLHVPELTD